MRMKFFKIAGIIIAVIALFVVTVVTVVGFGVAKTAEAVVETANQEVVQEIMHADGQTTIVVPLIEEMGIKYENIALCTPPEHAEEMFFESVVAGSGLSAGSTCFNHNCTVSIGADDIQNIPEDIFMYVQDASGQCKKRRFATEGHIATLGYKATIEFTDELMQALGIDGDDYHVSSTNSMGYSAWQLMGTKKVSLSYPAKLPSDNLKINEQVKARIQFQ
jgi:hypothetical protein